MIRNRAKDHCQRYISLTRIILLLGVIVHKDVVPITNYFFIWRVSIFEVFIRDLRLVFLFYFNYAIDAFVWYISIIFINIVSAKVGICVGTMRILL